MFAVLIETERLRARIAEMARAVGAEPRPRLLAVLEGARPFADAICAELDLAPGSYGAIRLRSYGAETVSSGRIELVEDQVGDVRGRRVVVLEDIVDTGRTIDWLRRHLFERGAAAVEVHTLLSKPSRRLIDVELDGVGFEIPDEFVIGFGMDVAGRYRELPHIAVYDAEIAKDDAEIAKDDAAAAERRA